MIRTLNEKIIIFVLLKSFNQIIRITISVLVDMIGLICYLFIQRKIFKICIRFCVADWTDTQPSNNVFLIKKYAARQRSSTILGITISPFSVRCTSGSSQNSPWSSNHLSSVSGCIIFVHHHPASPLFLVAVGIAKFLYFAGHTSTPAEPIKYQLGI